MEQTKKNKILVVDDSPINIDALSALLSSEYEVAATTRGDIAISIATSESPPALILLDIMMPEMDGYTVCQKIKKDPIASNIPIIFVTSRDEIENEEKGFEVGAADYITKPFTPRIVKARVKTHIALYEKTIALQKNISKLEKTVRVLGAKLRQIAPPKKPQNTAEKAQVVQQKKEVSEYFLDDHIADLKELEEFMDAEVNMMCMRLAITKKEMEKIGKCFKRYGEILCLYPVFQRLGNGIVELAGAFSNQSEVIDGKNLTMALSCLEALTYTLSYWRGLVFNNEIDNPNAFDNSILADINFIVLALGNKMDEISNNMEFF